MLVTELLGSAVVCCDPELVQVGMWFEPAAIHTLSPSRTNRSAGRGLESVLLGVWSELVAMRCDPESVLLGVEAGLELVHHVVELDHGAVQLEVELGLGITRIAVDVLLEEVEEVPPRCSDQ